MIFWVEVYNRDACQDSNVTIFFPSYTSSNILTLEKFRIRFKISQLSTLQIPMNPLTISARLSNNMGNR